MFIISCRVCTVEFEAKTKRRVYCTKRCNDKGKPSANTLSCFICSKPMAKGSTSLPQGEAAHQACRVDTPDRFPHGTTSRYAIGCRCEPCFESMSTYNRSNNDAFREANGFSHSAAQKRRFREAHGYWPQRDEDWVTPFEREAIYERDNYTCWLCNEPCNTQADKQRSAKAPTLDHIKPRSKGGTDDAGNLRTACRSCNSRRGNSGAMSLEKLPQMA